MSKFIVYMTNRIFSVDSDDVIDVTYDEAFIYVYYTTKEGEARRTSFPLVNTLYVDERVENE